MWLLRRVLKHSLPFVLLVSVIVMCKVYCSLILSFVVLFVVRGNTKNAVFNAHHYSSDVWHSVLDEVPDRIIWESND